MGAGRQKWWRDFTQECAAWTGSDDGRDYRLIEARTEAGITVRMHLEVTQPMFYGVVRLDGDELRNGPRGAG